MLAQTGQMALADIVRPATADIEAADKKLADIEPVENWLAAFAAVDNTPAETEPADTALALFAVAGSVLAAFDFVARLGPRPEFEDLLHNSWHSHQAIQKVQHPAPLLYPFFWVFQRRRADLP